MAGRLRMILAKLEVSTRWTSTLWRWRSTRRWGSACLEVAKAQFSEVEDVDCMARTLAVMQALSSEECRHLNRHLHVQALGVSSLKPHWLK